MQPKDNSAIDSVKEVIKEDGFSAYAVRFDINDKGEYFYDLKGFVNALMFEVPNFAFGDAYWKESTPTNQMQAVAEAAKAIYQIPEFKKVYDIYKKGDSVEDSIDDSFLRRGEFGELILFLLLKYFYNSVPLLSKIYFKDSDNATVHGFDAVHYQQSSKSLWLGESKLYEDGKRGLRELLKDIKSHIIADYLKREFVLVSKKFRQAPSIDKDEKEHIIEMLNGESSLEKKISIINIPLLCTFSSKTFSDFQSETEDFLKAYTAEMQELRKFFHRENTHPLKERLNIILLLMPVKSKKDFVKELHDRIYVAQNLIK